MVTLSSVIHLYRLVYCIGFQNPLKEFAAYSWTISRVSQLEHCCHLLCITLTVALRNLLPHIILVRLLWCLNKSAQ